jgi:hypothetical protein
MAIEEAIAEVAAELAPLLGVAADREHRVSAVLAELDRRWPVGGDLSAAFEQVLTEAMTVVRRHALLTVDAEPPQVWLDRAPADGPGLNEFAVQTLVAEYGVPGRAAQDRHARRFIGTTGVRSALRSDTFAAGWGLYAAQLMADTAAQSEPGSVAALGLRMQQLARQLQVTIGAIIDVRYHTGEMTEQEGVALIAGRGHHRRPQRLWRRAILHSTELSSDYVGYQEVVGVIRDLRQMLPDDSLGTIHEQVLAYGSPPPRLLRALLDLPQ